MLAPTVISIDPIKDGKLLELADLDNPLMSVNISPCGRIAVGHLGADPDDQSLQYFVVFDILFGHRCKFAFGPSNDLSDCIAITPRMIAFLDSGPQSLVDQQRLVIILLDYERKEIKFEQKKLFADSNRRLFYSNGCLVVSGMTGFVEFELFEVGTLDLIAVAGFGPPALSKFNLMSIRDRIDTGVISFWLWDAMEREMTAVKTVRRPDSVSIIRNIQTLNVDSGESRIELTDSQMGEWLGSDYPGRDSASFAASGSKLIVYYPNGMKEHDRLVEFDFKRKTRRVFNIHVGDRKAEWVRLGIQSANSESVFLLFGGPNLRLVHLDLWSLRIIRDKIGDETPVISENWRFPVQTQRQEPRAQITVDPLSAIRLELMHPARIHMSVSPCGRVLFFNKIDGDFISATDLMYGTSVRMAFGRPVSQCFATSKDELIIISQQYSQFFVFRCQLDSEAERLSTRLARSFADDSFSLIKSLNCGDYVIAYGSRRNPSHVLTLINTRDMESLRTETAPVLSDAEFCVLNDWTELYIVQCPVRPKHQLIVGIMDMRAGEYRHLYTVALWGNEVDRERIAAGNGLCMHYTAWMGSRLFVSHSDELSAERRTDLLQWVDVRDGTHGKLDLMPTETEPKWPRGRILSADNGGFYAIFGCRGIRCVRVPAKVPTSLLQLSQTAMINAGLERKLPPYPPIPPLFQPPKRRLATME